MGITFSNHLSSWLFWNKTDDLLFPVTQKSISMKAYCEHCNLFLERISFYSYSKKIHSCELKNWDLASTAITIKSIVVVSFRKELAALIGYIRMKMSSELWVFYSVLKKRFVTIYSPRSSSSLRVASVSVVKLFQWPELITSRSKNLRFYNGKQN